MEVNNITKEYNEQRNRHCKTLEVIIKDVVEDMLQAIDDDLYELNNDIKSGNYSFNEIVERIEEIRGQII